MTPNTLTLVHNNAYDAVLVDINGVTYMHKVEDTQTFINFLLIGDAQDIENWSGEICEDGIAPAGVGDTVAINDGNEITVTNISLFAQRAEFYGAKVEISEIA